MRLPYTSNKAIRLARKTTTKGLHVNRAKGHNILSLLFVTYFLGSYNEPAMGHCPSTLFGGEIPPPLQGTHNSWSLFAKKEANGKEIWQKIPLQIDPVDEFGRLVLPSDSKYRVTFDNGDLVLFRTELFGKEINLQQDKLPCSGTRTFQISDIEKRKHAYLTQCENDQKKDDFPSATIFDEGNGLLETDSYIYRFNKKNYLLFDEIQFRNHKSTWEKIAASSEMLIRADVRNFLTMQFDSSHIESKLEKTRLGPIGNLARLSFFLRILFFRLDISLSTDVAFFQDSGYIPMMLNLPVDADRWLNPGSGIIYSWLLSDKAASSKQTLNMPLINANEIKKGWKNLAKIGLAYCHNSDCHYQFGVDLEGRHFVMDLVIKRSTVERGFFPMFVKDVEEYKAPLDWHIDISQHKKRMAMYFEVSGLPKGGHPWNFWLKLGGHETHQETCPLPYHIKPVVLANPNP